MTEWIVRPGAHQGWEVCNRQGEVVCATDELLAAEQRADELNGQSRPKAPWLQQLGRIEQKLDTLIQALAEDEDESPRETLEGTEVPRPKGETRSL